MERRININSEINNICDVEYFLNSLFKELKFSRKVYCKIYLAVNEAVNNAIIHGNKEDSKKLVQISFNDESEYYCFIVKDQGDGFDYTILKSPIDSNNLYKESGRGIFIMKQYSDKVIFDDKGRKVKMLFNK
ncbi:MAG: ATP-binding protein [Prolixibacteraceae bacterium]|jgi:serine/threonine-protein kinase RsbW|nr:ATP-binding protein [Prolixibacteraceae bacterium]